MTGFVPLLTSSSDDFELALLRSTAADDLGAEALLKTAAALGLGIGAGVGVALPVASASQLTVSSSPAILWSLTLKGLSLGFLGGLAVTIAAHFAAGDAPRTLVARKATPSASLNPRSQPSISALVEALPTAVALPPPSGAPAFAVSVGHASPLPVVSATLAPSSKPRLVSQPPAPPVRPAVAAFDALPAPLASARSASIAVQIQMIENARQALAQARAAEVLDMVRDYRAHWPNGELIPEAILLGVRAKMLLSDRAGAQRDAQALIARDPNGRYAAQLQSLLGIAPQE